MGIAASVLAAVKELWKHRLHAGRRPTGMGREVRATMILIIIILIIIIDERGGTRKASLTPWRREGDS